MNAYRYRRAVTSLRIFLLATVSFAAVSCTTVAVTDSISSSQRSQRDALLILPGLGDDPKGRRHMKRFGESLAEHGYDVFVPRYRRRDGLQATADAIGEFLDSHHLDEYASLHIFTYILGAWSLNTYLLHEGNPANLTTIIYDRSPTQERAPRIVVDSFGGIVQIFFGDVVEDVAGSELPLPAREGVHVGLVIENKATSLLRRNREEALAMGPLEWESSRMDPQARDAIYLWLDHDDMYVSFDEIGFELIHFMEGGGFSDQARRIPFDRDPFEK